MKHINVYHQLVCLSVLISLICAQAMADKKTMADKNEPPVLPVSKGKVSGYIYNAETGLPLKGARVSLLEQSQFTPEQSTDKAGAYSCNTFIGRNKTKYNLLDCLFKSPIEIVSGGGSENTKWVNVTHFPIKVSCPGYKSFQGIAGCENINADKFSVTLPPVLLATTASAYESTLAPGGGFVRLIDVNIDPPIIRPKESATITVHVQGPIPTSTPNMVLECQATTTENANITIKKMTSPTLGKDGLLLFTTTIKAPKVKKATAYLLSAKISDCPMPVIAIKSTGSVKFYVVLSDDEEKVAKDDIANCARTKSVGEISLKSQLAEVSVPIKETQEIPLTGQSLDRAISNAKLYIGKECKDFKVWHKYGQLLYRKPVQRRQI